jgi:hypothetical protein
MGKNTMRNSVNNAMRQKLFSEFLNDKKVMVTYSTILQGSEATEENARNFAQGFDFSECETEEFNYNSSNYIDTVSGIDIYYNWKANYYFFSNKTINK